MTEENQHTDESPRPDDRDRDRDRDRENENENGHQHHHGAGHSHTEGASRLAIGAAFGITLLILVAEVVGGILSGSLALLADAGHMIGDAGALGMALWAAHIARRPADEKKSFGYRRVEVLAAFINALLLFVVVAMILREIPERFLGGHEVQERPMMIVAAIGLVANLVSGAILLRASRHSINVRGALLHVLSDSLGSVAVLAAGGIIWATGWRWADPAASLVIAALITIGAVRLLRETWHILMEGCPRGVDGMRLRAGLEDIEGVRSVHSVHIWSITPGIHALTAHLVTGPDVDGSRILTDVRALLPEEMNMEHVTVQIEQGCCEDPADCMLGCGEGCG